VWPSLRFHTSQKRNVKALRPSQLVTGSHVCFYQQQTFTTSFLVGEVPVSAVSTCSKWHAYSITSSAPTRIAGLTVMSSAFAVFKLTTNSNFVGCSTGSSAGLAPFKILSTKAAAR
jgi:hypothetical protein